MTFIVIIHGKIGKKPHNYYKGRELLPVHVLSILTLKYVSEAPLKLALWLCKTSGVKIHGKIECSRFWVRHLQICTF